MLGERPAAGRSEFHRCRGEGLGGYGVACGVGDWPVGEIDNLGLAGAHENRDLAKVTR
jgi:hypothetical protein